MATKYQVFVSSTFDDLKEERNAVIKAVLEMGHIPVGMEMFSAADEEQWRIISRHIDESDYYVVIVAHRYGSITDGVSYTRKEYEYARSKKVPLLGFVIDPNASWPGNKTDVKDADRKGLDAFKKVIQQKPVNFWSSADDLHGKFSIALMKAITASPREGWVRASEAVGPGVVSELSRLSSENAELRTAIRERSESTLANKTETMVQMVALMHKRSYKMKISYHDRSGWDPAEIDTPLKHIFRFIAPLIIIEGALSTLVIVVALAINPDQERISNIVPLNQMAECMSDLMTLGMAMPSTRRHSVNDKEEYWSLTELGIEVFKAQRLARMEEEENSES